jgi:anaerobic selenocysteine-containing dehydrogenase
MYQDQKGRGGMAWIKETSQKSLFLTDGKENLISFSPVVALENKVFDGDYPFAAILGSSHYHLGSGTRTGSSCRIQELGLKGEIKISSEDGIKLDLHDGDIVKLSSRSGAVARAIRLEKGLQSGLVFVPIAFNGNDAMNLIDLTQLGAPDSCGLKTCQVKIEKL